MNLLRYFLFLLLSAFAAERFNTIAQESKPVGRKSRQEFKVIEETKDYILKECDSVYYYSHGIEPKDDFIIDTTKIHKVNGVLKLPLDNGKEVVFRDTVNPIADFDRTDYIYDGEDMKNGFYFIDQEMHENTITFWINKRNGKIDTVGNIPIFSPKHLYYGYCNVVRFPEDGGIVFRNLRNGKITKIAFDKHWIYILNEPRHYLKWINDKSFVFYLKKFNTTFTYSDITNYYLVQIKQ